MRQMSREVLGMAPHQRYRMPGAGGRNHIPVDRVQLLGKTVLSRSSHTIQWKILTL